MTTCPISSEEFEHRCAEVVEIAFGGKHHVFGFSVSVGTHGWPSCSFTAPTDMFSTWDTDRLTRLVVAALDRQLRCELDNGGPRRFKVRLYPRAEHAGIEPISYGIPKLEDHVAMIRGQITKHELWERMK